MARTLRLAFLALVLGGCPQTRRVPTACTHVGEQCRMPDGPLGVCSETSSTCATPPCLACTSQH